MLSHQACPCDPRSLVAPAWSGKVYEPLLQCCGLPAAHSDKVPRDHHRRRDWGLKASTRSELKNTGRSRISFLFCLFLSGSTKSTALMAEAVFYLDVSWGQNGNRSTSRGRRLDNIESKLCAFREASLTR